MTWEKEVWDGRSYWRFFQDDDNDDGNDDSIAHDAIKGIISNVASWGEESFMYFSSKNMFHLSM